MQSRDVTLVPGYSLVLPDDTLVPGYSLVLPGYYYLPRVLASSITRLLLLVTGTSSASYLPSTWARILVMFEIPGMAVRVAPRQKKAVPRPRQLFGGSTRIRPGRTAAF